MKTAIYYKVSELLTNKTIGIGGNFTRYINKRNLEKPLFTMV